MQNCAAQSWAAQHSHKGFTLKNAAKRFAAAAATILAAAAMGWPVPHREAGGGQQPLQ